MYALTSGQQRIKQQRNKNEDKPQTESAQLVRLCLALCVVLTLTIKSPFADDVMTKVACFARKEHIRLGQIWCYFPLVTIADLASNDRNSNI